MEDLAPCQGTSCSVCRKKARRDLLCKSEDSEKQNLYNYVGESTSTFASEKGPPLADVERLKGNMRRELRNEKYPFNCTDFASPNLRIYTLLLPLVIWYIVSYGEKSPETPTDDAGPSGDSPPHVDFRNPVASEGVHSLRCAPWQKRQLLTCRGSPPTQRP